MTKILLEIIVFKNLIICNYNIRSNGLHRNLIIIYTEKKMITEISKNLDRYIAIQYHYWFDSFAAKKVF